MKKLLLTTVFLSACSMYTVKYDPCGPVPMAKCDPTRWDCSCKGHDGQRFQPPASPPPVPGTEDPPAVKDPDVCDGGARACRDGEQPTGTVSDPTKYLDKDAAKRSHLADAGYWP